MKTCFEGRPWWVLELLSWPIFEHFFFSLSCFATPKAVSERRLRLKPYELLSRNMDINLPCLPELSAYARRPFRLPRQRMESAGYHRGCHWMFLCAGGCQACRRPQNRPAMMLLSSYDL